MIGSHLIHGVVGVTVESGAPKFDVPPEGTTAWVDIEGPDEDDFELLEKRWKFHKLAIEDCVHSQKRAKYERYATHSFVVAVALDHTTQDALDTTAIRIFIRGPLVVTVHDRESPPIERVAKQLREDPTHIGATPGRLIHALLDAALDEFMPLLDKFEARADGLERSATLQPAPQVVDGLISLRRDLLTLRRMTVPMQETLRRLMDSPETTVDDRIYLRDVLDHLLALSDTVTVQLDVCNGALQVHANIVNERTNEVMKYLAIVSTFLLPMTVISGAFGMNFDIIPTTKEPLGFWGAIALMVGSALALLFHFRRKQWL